MRPTQRLSPVFIKTSDQQGAAVTVEPGLNLITHVGWSINPGALIVRNPEFSSLAITNQVRGTFHGLDVPNYG